MLMHSTGLSTKRKPKPTTSIHFGYVRRCHRLWFDPNSMGKFRARLAPEVPSLQHIEDHLRLVLLQIVGRIVRVFVAGVEQRRPLVRVGRQFDVLLGIFVEVVVVGCDRHRQ